MKVCSFKNQARASLVRNRLEEAGFSPIPVKTSSHVSNFGGNLFYYVEVPESEAEDVKKFLIDQGYEEDLV